MTLTPEHASSDSAAAVVPAADDGAAAGAQTAARVLAATGLQHASLLDDAGHARLSVIVDAAALPLSFEQTEVDALILAADGSPVGALADYYGVGRLRLIVVDLGPRQVDTAPAGHRL